MVKGLYSKILVEKEKDVISKGLWIGFFYWFMFGKMILDLFFYYSFFKENIIVNVLICSLYLDGESCELVI